MNVEKKHLLFQTHLYILTLLCISHLTELYKYIECVVLSEDLQRYKETAVWASEIVEKLEKEKERDSADAYIDCLYNHMIGNDSPL